MSDLLDELLSASPSFDEEVMLYSEIMEMETDSERFMHYMRITDPSSFTKYKEFMNNMRERLKISRGVIDALTCS